MWRNMRKSGRRGSGRLLSAALALFMASLCFIGCSTSSGTDSGMTKFYFDEPRLAELQNEYRNDLTAAYAGDTSAAIRLERAMKSKDDDEELYLFETLRSFDSLRAFRGLERTMRAERYGQKFRRYNVWLLRTMSRMDLPSDSASELRANVDSRVESGVSYSVRDLDSIIR